MLAYIKPTKEGESKEKTLSPEAYLVDSIVTNDISIKDAISMLSKDKSVPYSKNELYQASLKLKDIF